MSLFDYLTLIDPEKNNADFLQLKGTFSINFGDTVMAFIGAGRQIHVVGDEIKYVVHWQNLLKRFLPEVGPVAGVWDLLAGAGGNCTFTFGRQTSLTYDGPRIDVRRAGTVKVTSQSQILSPDPVPNRSDPTVFMSTTSYEWQQKQKIAKGIGIAVSVLSGLMIAANTGLEIATKWLYSQGPAAPPSPPPAPPPSPPVTPPAPPSGDPIQQMVIFNSDLMITSRMMAIILHLEKIAALIQNKISGLYWAKKAAQQAGAALPYTDLPSLKSEVRKFLRQEALNTTELLQEIAVLVVAIALVSAEMVAMSMIPLPPPPPGAGA